jgi:N-methylhydantoinase B
MLDYSTAVFDVHGGIIAQSTRIPMHLNSMTRALRTMLVRFPLEAWREGDVYATNDPYSGGQHLPDIQTFAAVLVDGEPIAITGTLGHHLDVGGRAAASYGADATEIYQEGFRIPPTRIVSAGVPNEVFFPLFEANIRVPHKTISDLRAQIAALSIGAGEVIRLARRYGAETIGAATRELIESSERRMRAAICAVPAGIYEAEDIVDGDGLDDHELSVRVAVERRGDTLHVDFSGTAAQTRGPINCPLASTESAVYYAVTAILDPGIAPNHGSYLPIEVLAPEGSVLNPLSPAPVVGRNVFTHRVATVVMAESG